METQVNVNTVLLGVVAMLIPFVGQLIKKTVELGLALLDQKLDKIRNEQATKTQQDALTARIAAVETGIAQLWSFVGGNLHGQGESKASGRRATDLPPVRQSSEAGTGNQSGPLDES